MTEMQVLASEMGLAYFDRFGPGEPPAAADAFREADRDVGFWIAYHFLLNQMGYEVGDEIDASFQSIRSRLLSLVELRDADAAYGQIADLRERLDEVEDEIAERATKTTD